MSKIIVSTDGVVYRITDNFEVLSIEEVVALRDELQAQLDTLITIFKPESEKVEVPSVTQEEVPTSPVPTVEAPTAPVENIQPSYEQPSEMQPAVATVEQGPAISPESIQLQ